MSHIAPIWANLGRMPNAFGAAPQSSEFLSLSLRLRLYSLPWLFLAIAYWSTGNGVLDFRKVVVGWDFADFWTAGVFLTQHRLSSIFDISAFDGFQRALWGSNMPFHLWSYPPTALFIMAPLGILPYIAAYIIWLLITGGICLWGASRLGLRGWQLALLAISPAMMINAIAGQTGALAAGLLLGGVGLMSRRPIIAGILFGLLTIKPQLGLLVPIALIAARNWRCFGAAALTAVTLVVASILAFGLESWVSYFTVSGPLTASIIANEQGMFVRLMPTWFMAARLVGLPLSVGLGAQLISLVASAILIYWSYRSSTPVRPGCANKLLLIGSLLATPYTHSYDMIGVAAALLLGLVERPAAFKEGWRYYLLTQCWILPWSIMVWNGIHFPLGPVMLWLLMIDFYRSVTRSCGTDSPLPTGHADTEQCT